MPREPPRERLRRAQEAVELLPGEGRVRVCRREVRHQPDDRRPRLTELGEPPAAHPGVELEVERHTLGQPLVGGGQLEPRLAGEGDLDVLGRPENEDAGVRLRGAEGQRLADRRDAQRRRAARKRRPGNVGCTVSVPVGLDDRPELGRSDDTGEASGVAVNGADVDRDERAGHGRILAGARHDAPRPSR